MKRNAWIAVLTAVCLMLTAGCAAVQTAQEPQPSETQLATEAPQPAGPVPQGSDPNEHTVEAQPLGAVTAAASYEEVWQLLAASYVGLPTRGWATDDAEAVNAVPAAEGGADGVGGADYGTNVQVAGVDELDTLKTDGTWLYVLTDEGFRILRADGADTQTVSRTDYKAGLDDAYVTPLGLFLGEDRVALLYQYDRWGTDQDGKWFSEYRTGLAIYDVTDRAAPALLADVRQDGGFCAARMADGRILLVTDYYVGYAEDGESWDCVPTVYRNGEAAQLSADRIYLCPQTEQAAFTFVTSYSLADGGTVDSCAFTDGSDIVYMNGDALYLGRTITARTASEPYTENQYTVTDYLQQTTTEVKRIALADGRLTLTGTADVPGSLLNQFSMDVYDGCLRLATTTYSESYSVYADEAYGWENYRWYDSAQNNRVTVLDASMQELGVLEDLVADEQIYSVRFLGTMGYVVTYEQIDPVFTIDLSDPRALKLESALEVPGVSQYLHPYGEGRLFGLGQALNGNNASEGVQLSMFDVTDPAAVRLAGQTVTDYGYTEAIYDHHAVFVSPAQNLIGFAAERYDDWSTDYVLYEFDVDGFSELGAFALPSSSYGLRAVCVDGCLYLCSRYAVTVVALDGLEEVAYVSEAMG